MPLIFLPHHLVFSLWDWKFDENRWRKTALANWPVVHSQSRDRAVLALLCVAPVGGSFPLSGEDCSPGWCSNEANLDLLKQFFVGVESREANQGRKLTLRSTLRAPWGSLWGVLAEVDKIHHLSLHDWGSTMGGVPVTAELRVHMLSGLENENKQKTRQQPYNTTIFSMFISVINEVKSSQASKKITRFSHKIY